MLQPVFVAASIADGDVNPVGSITLPVTGGAAVSDSGPVTLSPAPVSVASLGANLLDVTGNPATVNKPPILLDSGAGDYLFPDVGSIDKPSIMFPLDDGDWLFVGRSTIGRITGGAVAWSTTVINGTSGFAAIPCAIVVQGSTYYVFVRGTPNDFTDPGLVYYTTLDITGVSPPGLFNTWDSIDLEPSFVSLGLYGHEAVALATPSFDYAMVADVTYSGDGVTVLNKAVLVGPAVDVSGDKEFSGYGVGETFSGGFSRFFGAFTATLSVTAGTITDCVRAYSPATYTQAAVGALVPAGTEPNMEYSGAFLMIGEPPPVPPFWTNLRRAIEVI